ncbi:hypothetical protein ACXYTJ_10195 [Gilvimarinus sp. F26214L]|uniref:hypothetical protein n=1 Tax=Gilvimarinus sp. DZF01 TaxID=3461371 RepID=UPI00404658EA
MERRKGTELFFNSALPLGKQEAQIGNSRKKGTELFFNSALPVGQQEAQNGDKIFSPQNARSQ